MKSISSYPVQLLYGGISLIAMCGILTPELANAATVATPAITYGTYIQSDYYDDYNYSPSTPGGGYYASPSNYTNQIMTQTDTATNPYVPGNYASVTASLSSNQLTVSAGVNVGASNSYSSYAGAEAEMWDTLRLSHLPTGDNVNTVVGTLNMQVHTNGGVSDGPGLGVPVDYGLSLYNPALFITTRGDCGGSGSCGGFIAGSKAGIDYNNPVNPNSTTNLSIPITMGELTNGNVAYVAEIWGSAYYYNPSFSIDPSISLTGLYPGVTVTSLSGTNYVAPVSPVPVPGAWVLMVSGLGLLGFMLRLKSGFGLIRNWDPIQNLA